MKNGKIGEHKYTKICVKNSKYRNIAMLHGLRFTSILSATPGIIIIIISNTYIFCFTSLHGHKLFSRPRGRRDTDGTKENI